MLLSMIVLSVYSVVLPTLFLEVLLFRFSFLFLFLLFRKKKKQKCCNISKWKNINISCGEQKSLH